MSRIIKYASFHQEITYEHQFVYASNDTWGFSFPTDEHGNLINTNEAAIENYQACLTGNVRGSEIIDRGIVRREHQVRDPAIMRCDCGTTIELWPNAYDVHQCDQCTLTYNGSGQALKPMSEWDEPWDDDD